MTNLSETVNTLQLSAKAYKLAGRIAYAGLPVSVETRKGQKRSGTGADGKPWIVTMPWDYGYINLPKTKGQDGQKVDCFIGPDKKAQYVYIIHQGKEANVDKYDEDKVMLGFSSADAALKAYKSAYVGVDLYQGMSVMSLDAFKKKLLSTRTKKKNFKLHAGGPGSGRHKGFVTLYHGTSVDNGKKILKNGFKVGNSPREYSSGEKYSGKTHVYLTSDKHTAHYYGSLDLRNKGHYALVKVKVPAEKVKHLGQGVYVHKGNIGPEHVVSVEHWKGNKEQTHFQKLGDIHADFGGFFPDDYYQFTEKTGMQPLPSKHPPSLKKPIDVPSDNPDDKEDKYKDRKKRRSKRTLRDTQEFTRHQTGKPEIAQTTTFVPIDQG